ncbi:MAG TPA: hypothetical protein VFD19_01205 [Clostridia bacterium]|nr:hypothetical protein [Clostridia bacterium]
MKKDTVYTLYWFFASAPFATAIPLFFLMPEHVPPYFYALAMIERGGTRWELFMIPAVWMIASLVLHLIFKILERSLDILPARLAIPRVLTSVIFCGLAISMELILYRNAMMML